MFDNDIKKSNYTLLYAEDEPEVRGAYKLFFEDYFNTVLIAENGTEAWEKYSLNKPAIIVLDIKMPGMDGIEVAKKIREHDKDAILIIMTANDTKEWLYASVELGLKKFIKKGTKKFTEFETILLDIIAELDEKTTIENDKDLWYITPKDSPIEIIWNTISQKLYKNGKHIELTKKLTQIIFYFSQNPGRIISHEEIANYIWSNGNENLKTPTEQKIRTFLYTIKRKVGLELFKAHYKQGYTLEADLRTAVNEEETEDLNK